MKSFRLPLIKENLPYLLYPALMTGIRPKQYPVMICLLIKPYLPPLESEDTFYWKDLIGISVYDEEGTFLGILESIIETGSNDVYVVKKDEEEILIPALASVVKAVDVSRKSMHVSIPEGLL